MPDLKSLFMEALDQTPGPDRAAYLNGACRGDDHLRTRVDELIDFYLRTSSTLEPSTSEEVDDAPPEGAARLALGMTATSAHGSTTAPRPIAEGPGTRIGPYRLLQKIGEGGMGIVFMAEQEQPVRRKVALKVIKPGMDTAPGRRPVRGRAAGPGPDGPPEHRQGPRRRRDRSGRPYFVMELVKGVPITEYCDRVRLSPRERLELFVPVCQAIQHAHQKGIIHRDIKPSNVLVTLVDGKPVPKVIDFGVAKAVDQRLTERTLFTQFGAVVGTPEYMSPEQAELSGLDVDTRSDIYSLGVLLYELLTGTTPLERARLREGRFREVLRRIREEEPPRPSTRLAARASRCRRSRPAATSSRRG